MPKTKLQDFIFSVMMVVCMVYCMTTYNIALEQGFSIMTFWHAFCGMWPEAVMAFFVQRFIGKRAAERILHQLVDVKTARPLFISVCVAAGNVIVMAPCMTLLVNIMHHGISPELISCWLPKLVLNFPFALCIQIFYVGPFARFMFKQLPGVTS